MRSLTRRTFTKSVAAASFALWPRSDARAMTPPCFGDDARQRMTRYLESLAKPGGGYGWAEQPDAYLTVTFAVVGTYHNLGIAVPRAADVAAFIRKGHPINGPFAQTRRHWTELKEFTRQQIQALLWLGEPVDGNLRKQVESWKTISSYTTAYEKSGNPVLRQEVQPLLCRRLLGLPCDALTQPFGDYFAARQRANGTFNTTPAADGSDGHVVNTLFGLCAREALGLPEGLHAYTIQFQAPGEGSIIEAVELARHLHIDLWGAKNSTPEWLAEAQRLATSQKVPVTFFASNEEYGTRVSVPGLGSFTHVNDPAAAPGQPLSAWPRREGPWQIFRKEKIEALRAARGAMLWQICDNEEFARVLLDESLLRGGYDAISSFHFGCHNMLWTLPYMMRYRHEIPIVSLQDAHGEAWWWRGMLTGFRTLFLAREPTWEGWLEALREKRVVAVRHDLRTNGILRMLGGSNEVRKAFLDRTAEWQWWKNDTDAVLEQMPVAIAVLRPENRFETGHPEKGLNVRIRLRQEWAENKKLTVASPVTCETARIGDQTVKPEHVERKDAKGLLEDAYELIRFAEAPENSAVLELVFREQTPSGSRTFTRSVHLKQ